MFYNYTRKKILFFIMQSIKKHSFRCASWCLDAESNHGHGDFQSPALPTELSRLIKKMATRIGLEPTTSSVTG